MSSNIISSLANATKALNAHQFGVTTAGNNLANVNNPDYARQRVVIGEDGMVNTIFGPVGLGVEVQAFEHMRDTVLDREVLRETSINASLTAQQAALAKAESSVGQEINRSGDSPFIDGANSSASGMGGLSETLNEFFNAFHSLSANPGSDAEKEALVQKAQILTERFNVTADRFSDLKEDLTLEVNTDLGEANALIKEIARLNAEIARAESNKAGQALSLRDQRQALLEDLSERIDFKTEEVAGSSGQIRVYVPTIGADKPQLDLVNLGRYQEIDFTDSNGSGSSPKFAVGDDEIQIEIRGGSIHGALTARDGAITKYARGLDDLAKEMVTMVNSLYSASPAVVAANIGSREGSSLSSADIDAYILANAASGKTDIELAAEAVAADLGPGSPSLSDLEDLIEGQTNFFENGGDPSELTASGIRLAAGLDSTTLRTSNASLNKGDNQLILAIAELDDVQQGNLGNRNFASFYRSVVTDLGENVAKVESRLDDESIVFNLLKEQQDAVSGVSIDEEMTDMMKYQRAYEATGKLIRAIDEMLDVIINRLI